MRRGPVGDPAWNSVPDRRHRRSLPWPATNKPGTGSFTSDRIERRQETNEEDASRWAADVKQVRVNLRQSRKPSPGIDLNKGRGENCSQGPESSPNPSYRNSRKSIQGKQ